MIAAEDRSETYRVSIVRFAKAFNIEADRIIVDQRNPNHEEGHCENRKR